MVETKKKFPLLLTVGTAAVLIGGGGAAYWFLSQPKASPEDLPVGAEVIPQDALMTIAVTTDQGQWQQLREFGTPQSQAAFDKNLAQVRDRVLTANGFNYQQDIQPWIGNEVSVAFLAPYLPPASTTPGAPPPVPQQQAVMAVLPIRDALQAKQLLEKPRPQTGKLVTRNYKGVEIKESPATAAQKISVAALNGKYLLVTTDPKATDKAIDTYQGGPNLAATPGYNQALGRISTEQPFGKVYVNLPIAAMVTANNAGRPLTPENLAQMQQNQGLAATADLESEGIQFKSVSWLRPDSERKYNGKNNARIMPDRLPADTLMMVSGGSLKQFWQQYVEGAATSPVSPIPPDGLRSAIKSTVEMDWDQDFVNWMDGEFSLSLVSALPGSPPNLPFSLLFMVQASDRRAAETALKKLDDAMTNKYKVKVEAAQVAGQNVTNWTLPLGGSTVTHGWLDNNVAFLSLGAPIASGIIPKPAVPLAGSEAFKQAMPTELGARNGQFYMNVDQAVNAKRLPILQLPPGNRELVAAIKSIGVTAAITDSRTSRYDAFVGLQKAGKPAPLPSPTIPPAITPPEPVVVPSP